MEIIVNELPGSPVHYIGMEKCCISDLYVKHIKRHSIKPFWKITIYAVDDTRKEGEQDEMNVNCIDYHCHFNFEQYSNAGSTYDKKKMLLDLFLKTFLSLSAIKGWDKDVFLDAYNECIKKRLENNWWFKNKLFRSPDRRHFIGLYNRYDTDIYDIHIVLFDAQKKEIGRRLVFKDRFMNFELASASGKKTNDTFFFTFKGPKKIFKYGIPDILSDLPVSIPTKTAYWFK